MQRQFDETAHRVEARLRDLRQLIAGLPILMDAHEEMLLALVAQLDAVEDASTELRNQLLAEGGEWQPSGLSTKRIMADDLRAALVASDYLAVDEN
jgi:hypothetical protein